MMKCKSKSKVFEHQLYVDNDHIVRISVKRCFNVQNYFPTYEDIIYFLNEQLFLNKLTSEYSYVVGIKGLSISGILEIGKGDEMELKLCKKDLFRYILLTGAGGFITVHNHPISSSKPSIADLIIHKEMKQISDILDVKFLNEFIVSDEGFYEIETGKIRFF